MIRFIEDNWSLGRIGDGSFDELAGPITQMFDFRARRTDLLFLDRDTGLQTSGPVRGDARDSSPLRWPRPR